MTTPTTQPAPTPVPLTRLTDRERALIDRVLATAARDAHSLQVAAFNSSI